MQNNMLSLGQLQVMSAKQVQSLEILTYTNQELENFLLNEYLENPMLENTLDKHNDMMKDLEQMYEKSVSYKEHYTEWQEEDSNRKNDIKAERPEELKNSILNQLNRNDFSEMEWKLMGYLIQCLDEKGFFLYEVSDIAKVLGYQDNVVNKCLNVLKELEPVGIFSRDICECLQKQLEKKGINNKEVTLMLGKHFTDIMNGRISVVSRSLKLSTSKVREYIHLIGTLNPRPVMNLQSEREQYIVPDIVVTLEKRQWHVEINDRWMGEYKYNEYYINLMQESQDESLKQYFKEKLERAKFIIFCVEQRRGTIIRIVEALLKVQEDYFVYDKELKPMSMETVARMADMHVSTVSRAIRDKHIQYKKTVLIKDLFTMSAATQEDISVDVIKKQIQEMIRAEASAEPLSDQKIVERMHEAGINISRRTIAKYRKQLGIPDSRQRLYL
ncbi:RNA polymerase factor sigma-54 [Lachnospiraceae bacterium 54-53]